MVKDSLIEEYNKYNPEEDFNGAQGIELANQLIERYGSIENVPKLIDKKNKEDKLIKKENDLEKMLIFIKRVNGMDINPDTFFVDRDTKEKLIREYKGNKDYFSNLSNYQLGITFKRLYNSALKKTKK